MTGDYGLTNNIDEFIEMKHINIRVVIFILTLVIMVLSDIVMLGNGNVLGRTV